MNNTASGFFFSLTLGSATVCSLPSVGVITAAAAASTTGVPVVISPRNVVVSIAKVVNPLGTVTTITESPTDMDLDHFGYCGAGTDDDSLILENCDEALFRPVVAVYSSETDISAQDNDNDPPEQPAAIGQELIVPVIEKAEADSRLAARKLACKQAGNVNSIDFERLSLKTKVADAKAITTLNTPVAAIRMTLQESTKKKAEVPNDIIAMKSAKESKVATEKCNDNESTIITKPKAKREKTDDKPTKSERIEKKSSPPPVDIPSSKSAKKSTKKLAKLIPAETKRGNTPPQKFDENLLVGAEDIAAIDETEIVEEFVAVKPKSRKKSIQQPMPPPLNVEETVTVTIKQSSFADMMKASALENVDKNIVIPDLEFEKIVVVKADDEVEATIKIAPTKKSNKKQKKIMSQDVDESPLANTVDDSCKMDVKPIDDGEIKCQAIEKVKRGKFSKESLAIVEPENIQSDDITLSEIDDFVEALPPLELPEIFTEPADEFKKMLKEEIQASTDDCSRIQDSLFRDYLPTATYKSKKTHLTDTGETASSVPSSIVPPSASTRRILQKMNLDNVKIISEAEFSDNLTLKKLEEQSNPHEPMIINLNDIEPDAPHEVRLIEFDTPVCDTSAAPLLPGQSSNCGKCTKVIDRKQLPQLVQSQSSIQHDSQDSDYKSLEFDIEEPYLSLESAKKYCETSSSDDNTEDSSRRCNRERKGDQIDDDDKVVAKSNRIDDHNEEEDEELQPLISSTTSQQDTSQTAPLVDVTVSQTVSDEKPLLTVDDEQRQATDDETLPIVDCAADMPALMVSMMDQDNLPELDVQEQEQMLQPQQVQQQPQQQSNNNGKKKSKKKRR